MRIFVTGATGYIGGAVAMRLLEAGHRVTGLVRNPDKAAALRERGIVPALGDLDDAAVLTREASEADAVINAASSDHRKAVETLLDAMAGTGKAFIHTSGSSVVADDALGEPADAIWDEENRPAPVPAKAARVALDAMIVAAAARSIRTVVICNTLIYGTGKGLHADSAQLPSLAGQARRSGIARHIGRGLNIWSTVHVDDMAELYLLALEKAPAGSFLFAEHGEASFRDMVAAIARRLGTAGPQPWPTEDAIREWGHERAVYALGSNSRVRSKRARALLGWAPREASVLDWIRDTMAR